MKPTGPAPTSAVHASSGSEVLIRSRDGTADAVHALANVPASTSATAVAAMATGGQGHCDRLDRTLFKGVVRNVPPGPATLAIVTFEPSGTQNVQRVPVTESGGKVVPEGPASGNPCALRTRDQSEDTTRLPPSSRAR